MHVTARYSLNPRNTLTTLSSSSPATASGAVSKLPAAGRGDDIAGAGSESKAPSDSLTRFGVAPGSSTALGLQQLVRVRIAQTTTTSG